jgi:hypothetical protein
MAKKATRVARSMVGGAQSTQAKFLRATMFGGVVPGVSPGTLAGLPAQVRLASREKPPAFVPPKKRRGK